jgi:hypothetical protein
MWLEFCVGPSNLSDHRRLRLEEQKKLKTLEQEV